MQTTKGFWAMCVSLFVLGTVLGMFITRGVSLSSRELQIFGFLALLCVLVAIGASLFYHYLSRSSLKIHEYLLTRLRLTTYFSCIFGGFVMGAVLLASIASASLSKPIPAAESFPPKTDTASIEVQEYPTDRVESAPLVQPAATDTKDTSSEARSSKKEEEWYATVFLSASPIPPNYSRSPSTLMFRASYVGSAAVCQSPAPYKDSIYILTYGDGTNAPMSYQGCATGDDGDIGEHFWKADDHTYRTPGTYTTTVSRDGVMVASKTFDIR